MRKQALDEIQLFLEEAYGARTGLSVSDFVRTVEHLPELGQILVEQHPESADLNVALLFDRDIFAAYQSAQNTNRHRSLSVLFEEVSHFVYLSFNHNRSRNVTALEMELQSEVDRILLAYHFETANVSADERKKLWHELLHKEYDKARYEEARRHAAKLLHQLCKHVGGDDPEAWTPEEFAFLRRFFHSDLSEKLHLTRKLEVR